MGVSCVELKVSGKWDKSAVKQDSVGRSKRKRECPAKIGMVGGYVNIMCITLLNFGILLRKK